MSSTLFALAKLGRWKIELLGKTGLQGPDGSGNGIAGPGNPPHCKAKDV